MKKQAAQFSFIAISISIASYGGSACSSSADMDSDASSGQDASTTQSETGSVPTADSGSPPNDPDANDTGDPSNDAGAYVDAEADAGHTPPDPTDAGDSGPTAILPYGYGAAKGPSGTWVLKLDDEFDGSSLDTSVWSTGWYGNSPGVTPPVQSQETACYDPANVVVGGGMLRLNAEARNTNCNKGSNPHPYASGAVNTKGKKEFTSGYFEARIWFDAGTQMYNWPAWWLDGTGTWPTTGELDILEGLSGTAAATWHGPEGGGSGHNFGKGGVLSGWHIAAASWENGTVKSYYDGVEKGSYTSATNVTSAAQFLILAEQMSPQDQYGGPVKAPSHMDIDYVRVWQRP